jgi:hypothetical protein
MCRGNLNPDIVLEAVNPEDTRPPLFGIDLQDPTVQSREPVVSKRLGW